MSEHAWVLENIASYNAGGLDAAECERLQRHVAACASCGVALHNARNVDRKLEILFTDVSANPALEDRMVQSLRALLSRRRFHSTMAGWIAGSAVAALLLGALGAGVTEVTGENGLAFPGMFAPSSRFATTFTDVGTAILQRDGQRDPELLVADTRLKKAGLTYNSSSAEAPTAGELAEQLAAKSEWQEAATSQMSGPLLQRGGRKSTEHWGRPAQLVGGATAARGINAPEQQEGEERSVPGSFGTVNVGPPAKAVPGFTQWPSNPTANPYLNLLRPGEPASPSKGTSSDPRTENSDSPFKPSEVSLAAQQRDEALSRYEAQKKLYYNNQGGIRATSKEDLTGALRAYNKYVEEINNSERDTFKPSELTYPELRVSEKTSEQRKDDPKAQPKPGGDQGNASQQKKPSEPPASGPVTPRKIIIRSGEIEFEIDSFDAAVAAISRLVGPIKNGFVATVNSEKLANGKVRGSVVVRVPPENLDALVADLRKELGKAGELKSQRIGSQDISKQYTDLESRVRAARAMEERLLESIKTGKGEIKDLLQAEKELGTWRTRIEEIEGELRYYANLVALSTLTITLYEKEIRAPSAITETERIQMGIEVEDVDKARQQVLAAVADAKGRITKADFKQYPGGQYSAVLQFEVAPETAGPLRDRLKQLGTLARLEIDRLQQTEGGSGPPQDIKVKRSDAQFHVSLYNLAKVEPRETVNLNLACLDVEAAYQAIVARVQKAAGRIVTSNLNRVSKEKTTGIIKFEVRAADAAVVLQGLKETGEVMRLQLTENPDSQNTTTSKRGFNVSLAPLDQVEPREKTDLQVATRDVAAGYRTLVEAVARAKGRMLNAQLNEQDKQNITAQLDFDVRRAEDAAIEAALAKIGDVYSRNVVRAQDNENVTDSKVRLRVALLNVARIPPRATYTVAIEVVNVDNTAAAIAALVHESQGRTVESHIARRADGGIVAKQVFDVPLAAAQGLLARFKNTGTVRVEEATRNPQVPETALAVARLDVTLSNEKLIVPSDNGLWPQVRKGLSNSLMVIFWSLSWVIFGVLVVLPWALLIYGIYRLVMRLRKRPGSATTTA